MNVAALPVSIAGVALEGREFDDLRGLIRRLTGIHLNDGKQTLVAGRLQRRLRALKLDSFRDYIEYVESDLQGAEARELVNAITTNKTSFFREPHHFDFMMRQMVPEIVARAQAGGPRKIRIWSAACSSGQEVWSIAIALQQSLGIRADWDVRILASDLDTAVLQRAEQAVYSSEEIAEVPAAYREAAFERIAVDRYRIVDSLRRLVTFRQINLVTRPWPIRARFDAVVCRNVAIYFDRPTQQSLFEGLASTLLPNGYLFSGHSENLHWLSDIITPVGNTVHCLRERGREFKVAPAVDAFESISNMPTAEQDVDSEWRQSAGTREFASSPRVPAAPPLRDSSPRMPAAAAARDSTPRLPAAARDSSQRLQAAPSLRDTGSTPRLPLAAPADRGSVSRLPALRDLGSMPRLARAPALGGRSGNSLRDSQVGPPSSGVVREADVSIHAGEIYASASGEVIRTLLGSCVSVCLFDPETRIGGMNHFMLPDGENAGRSAAAFGVHAMELLINRMMKLGADRRRFVAKVFGASQLHDDLGIAGENAAFAKFYLDAERIRILAHKLNGALPLCVYFDTGSGIAHVRAIEPTSEIFRAERDHRARLSVQARAAADVTLFDSEEG